MHAGDDNRPGTVTQALIVAPSSMSIHLMQKNLKAFKICLTGNKGVNETPYPCEVPLETVDIQLRLLSIDVGSDGEEVLRRGDMTAREERIYTHCCNLNYFQ